MQLGEMITKYSEDAGIAPERSMDGLEQTESLKVLKEYGDSVAAAILKRLILVLEGGSGATLGVRWYKDYSMSSSSTTEITLNPSTTSTTALYGAATSLWGDVKYTPIYGLEEYKTALTGSAKHLKLNMSIVSNGYDVSVQDLAIISKQGKIR